MLEKTFFATVSVIAITMTLLLMLLPTPEKSTPTGSSGNDFFIENIRLFDGEKIIESTSLLIKNGLIVSIGERAKPPAVITVDGIGKTLLPGLIDAHTHNFGNSLVDAINFGVTTQLDMFTNPIILNNQKSSRESTAKKTHADLFSAGVLATAPGGHGTQFGQAIETIDHPDKTEQWVSNRIAEGSDFIKLVYMPNNGLFSSIDQATASALIKAAHQNELLAVAHVSTLQDAQNLLDEGVDGLVHIFADKLVTDEFLQQAKQQKLFVIPTLSVISSANKFDTARQLAADSRVAPYLNAGQTQQLMSDFNLGSSSGFNFDIAVENTRRLHNAGITILAGSDAPNPGTSHGVSLHQELALLVQSGLSPVESLRAASSAAADAFRIKDRGRIQPGQRADFILVDGDPSSNISDSLSIHSIYKNGFRVARSTGAAVASGDKVTTNLLSDFSKGLTNSNAMVWSKTEDSMSNGTSTAQLRLVNDSLKVSAQVNQGFMFPWAGAAVFGENSLDLSDYKSLQFTIRGTAGSYRIMTFSGEQTGAPPAQTFEVKNEWQTIDFLLADFPGLIKERLNGLAIVAGPAQGEFEYYLKDVKLKR